jgi:YVTN family beta-propeller protein
MITALALLALLQAATGEPGAARPSVAVETALPGPRGTLVVLNKSDHTASLLALPGGALVATLPTGRGPHEVAVSPDGKTAAVADYGTREAPGKTLTLLDLPARKVRATLDLGEHRQPHGIAWLPEGRRLVVTIQDPHSALLVVDPARGVQAVVPTGQAISHMVALAPDGRRAWVSAIGSGTVSAIDLAGPRVVATVATGAGAEGIAVRPGGREVWVTNREADTVTVLDAATHRPLATLPCADFPIRVAFTPDGRLALVSTARSGEVAVFDAAARRELQRVAMAAPPVAEAPDRLLAARVGGGPAPVGILVPPTGGVAYVANTQADVVSVIDLERLAVVGWLRAGREPDGLGFSPLVLE